MTPLGERIAALIRAGGPMTVADYMAICLGDPEHGYYMRRDPFGRAGDFVTAPEVSQMFGELIGLWAVATFEAMEAPRRFVLAEAGPGRGTLMADLLRAAKVRPAFLAAAEVHLVETSPHLRTLQAERLAAVGIAPTWHDGVAGLPAGPLVFIANEFFDALPVRQLVKTPQGWAERMVGLDGEGRLAFGLRALEGLPHLSHGERSERAAERVAPGEGLRPHHQGHTPSPASRSSIASATSPHGRGEGPPPPSPIASPTSPPGRGEEILELSPASTAIMEALAGRIAQQGGAALVVDYGYEGPAFGDTLQAVRAHAYADPLAEPGEADLTAHVDFAALAAAAAKAGAVPRRLLDQGTFLRRIGLEQRARRLAAGKDAATEAAIAAAVERLAGPAAMGTLFKVLAVGAPGLALPAFDDDPPIRG